MKRLFPRKALSLAILLAAITFQAASAHYYVVIGSFKLEENAVRFTHSVRNVFQDVSYSFDKDRDLFLVHVFKSHLKEEALDWSTYVKKEKGFKDAWIFAGDAEEVKSSAPAVEVEPSREPRFGMSTFNESRNNNRVLASASGSENMGKYEAGALNAAWTHKGGFSFLRNPGNFSGLAMNAEAMGPQFRFIIEDPTGNPVDGEVLLVDFTKSKVLAGFRPGEHVFIKGTRRGQMITFVCEVIGYGMETRMFNIDHLSRGKDIVRTEDGIWEVHIKLEEMAVNDQAILYNTAFADNSTALKPTSKEQLDEVVMMMKLHPEYEIMIHSHCNKGPRREIALADDFFGTSVSEVRKGGDKFLTRQRARMVREYLVSNGIEKERIGTVAWGSTGMIVKPTSDDVRLNERIEMELVAK